MPGTEYQMQKHMAGCMFYSSSFGSSSSLIGSGFWGSSFDSTSAYQATHKQLGYAEAVLVYIIVRQKPITQAVSRRRNISIFA